MAQVPRQNSFKAVLPGSINVDATSRCRVRAGPTTVPMTAGADSFNAILRRLADAHKREVQASVEDLKKENERLQATLHMNRHSTDISDVAESGISLASCAYVEDLDGQFMAETDGRGRSAHVQSVSQSKVGLPLSWQTVSPPPELVGTSESALETPSRMSPSDETSQKNVVTPHSGLELLPLRPPWQKEEDVSSPLARMAAESWGAVSPTQSKERPRRMETIETITLCDHGPPSCGVGRLIHYPGHPARLAWDFVGAIWIMYDAIFIPLQAFDPPETTFLTVLDMIILIYWTLNMPASLMVGYVSKGVTEMRPRKILLNYLMTWFLVDMVVVVPDWIFLFQSLSADTSEEGSGDSIGLLRLLRFVRTARLVRLLKLRWILIMINDMLSSEYASIMANIAKMIVVLIVINHFLACIFFALASLQRGKGPTWVTEYGFDGASWGYQYLTAFHFSITQFTPASMHVQPENSAERMFTICVVIFALVGFSYLVGSITNSMTQLRSMSEDATKQFWVLRRYLKQHQVPLELSTRIQRYLEHAWARQKASAAEPKLFALLSQQLMQELKCARSLPHLQIHPLFKCLQEFSYISLQRLAVNAISWHNLAREDVLFLPKETATHVYFVVEGRLSYSRVDNLGNEFSEQVDRAEDWVAEPVLWTPTWMHLGKLMAEKEAALVLIDGTTFGRVIERSPTVLSLVSCYARQFMTWMSSVPPNKLSDISQGEDIGPQLQGYIDEAWQLHASDTAKYVQW